MKNNQIHAAVLGVGLLFCSSTYSHASLLVDMRFVDGSKTKSVDQGNLSPITMNAWAVVTGAPGNSLHEGLLYVITALKSSIVNTGISGAITSTTIGTGWNAINAYHGLASNLSNDGIGDWGNVSNTPLSYDASSGYFKGRSTKSINNPVEWGDANSTAGSIYHVLPDGGVEFLIGSYQFTPTAMVNGGSLKYIPVHPLGGINSPAGWYEDVTDITAAAPVNANNGVTHGVYLQGTPNTSELGALQINVIPEPTSLSILAIIALATQRRRRDVNVHSS